MKELFAWIVVFLCVLSIGCAIANQNWVAMIGWFVGALGHYRLAVE